MDKEKREIIKFYIYENIKMLENKRVAKEDKKIARMLIREEVDALVKRYKKAEKTKSTDLADLEQDFKEIANMLKSYLANPHSKRDNEIYKVYKKILFII